MALTDILFPDSGDMTTVNTIIEYNQNNVVGGREGGRV